MSAASKPGCTPWLQDADVTLYHGDVLTVLREFPAESVGCCVTSPPYWGLRDYGQEGQLGLEPTPEEYVTRMVEVFREVRRVLAAHGTVWLNLGDSYAGSWSGNSMRPEGGAQREGGPGFQPLDERVPARSGNVPLGLKPKDLVGIPWRVAFALQADGWYLRSDIIWAKPNPMPESVTDRPTKAHEYVFLLSKQPRYFFDQEAVREEATYPGPRWSGEHVLKHDQGNGKGVTGLAPQSGLHKHVTSGRNIRSVWEIATQPYPEAHFATFPEELARRCIAAGTSERGKCADCGAPWVREVEQAPYPRDATAHRGRSNWADGSGRNDGDITRSGQEFNRWKADNPATITWGPTCYCQHATLAACVDDTKWAWAKPVPSVVLDPFMGSGTVAHVARKLGRHAVGIDLNESYLELAARRLQQQSLFAEPYEPVPAVPRGPSPLTGGAYHPPGQTPHSNTRGKSGV